MAKSIPGTCEHGNPLGGNCPDCAKLTAELVAEHRKAKGEQGDKAEKPAKSRTLGDGYHAARRYQRALDAERELRVKIEEIAAELERLKEAVPAAKAELQAAIEALTGRPA